jgi:hypothetical protein
MTRAGMVASLQLGLPHGAQGGGADDERLFALVVGVILEQLLADPGLAQADRVGDHDAVVAGQDAARLLHRVVLELGQLDGGAGGGRRRLAVQVVAEVLVERLHVDFVGRVLAPAELGVFQNLDEAGFVIARLAPLLLVPAGEVHDGPRADLALEQAAAALAELGSEVRLRVEADLGAGRGVVHFVAFENRLVDQVQLAVGGQAGPGEVAAAGDAGDREEAVEERLLLAAAAVEQVTLGVQEAAAPAAIRLVAEVEAHLDVVAAQEADQLLDQLLRLFLERRGVQLVAEKIGRIGAGADVIGFVRLVAEQEAEAADAGQRRAQLLEAADAEIGGGDVELPAPVLEQVVEDFGEGVLDVVDDVGDFHGLSSSCCRGAVIASRTPPAR